MNIRRLSAIVVVALAVTATEASAWPVPGPVKTDPEEGVLVSPTGQVAVLAAGCTVAVAATSPYSGTAVIVGYAVAAGLVTSTTIRCYVTGGAGALVTASQPGPAVTVATMSGGPAVRGVCLQGSVQFLDGSTADYGSQFCTLNP